MLSIKTPGDRCCDSQFSQTRAPKVRGHTSPGHRPGFWETIRFSGPQARSMLSIKTPGDRRCYSPIQSDASTEGAWLYQPRPSAWVLGNHKISQGCRPDLCFPSRPPGDRCCDSQFSQTRAPKVRGYTSPGHRPGFWETIRFLRAAGPIYAFPQDPPGIGVVIPNSVRREHRRCVVIPAQAIGLGFGKP